MPKGVPLDLVGQRFGLWTVLEREALTSRGQVLWKCQCECGSVKGVQSGNLRSGQSTRCRSCGNRGGYNSRWDEVDGAEKPCVTRLTNALRLVLELFLADREAEMYGREVCEKSGLVAGTVYQILGKLSKGGWVAGRWEEGDVWLEKGRPPRRYWKLTDDGRAQAQALLRDRSGR